MLKRSAENMTRFLSLVFLTILGGCTSPSIRSSQCGGKVGHFSIPEGWEVSKLEGPSRVENMIQRIGDTPRSDPGITIDAFCRFDDRFPRTQKGCADSYLDGIHDVLDENVVFEDAGTVENLSHGAITVYRFHSEWFGEHLVAKIVTDVGYATIELWADTPEQREQNTASFHEFVRQVKLNMPNKTQHHKSDRAGGTEA